jgi:hypothetical protein
LGCRKLAALFEFTISRGGRDTFVPYLDSLKQDRVLPFRRFGSHIGAVSFNKYTEQVGTFFETPPHLNSADYFSSRNNPLASLSCRSIREPLPSRTFAIDVTHHARYLIQQQHVLRYLTTAPNPENDSSGFV